jgi:hypothetical protein
VRWSRKKAARAQRRAAGGCGDDGVAELSHATLDVTVDELEGQIADRPAHLLRLETRRSV